MPIFSNRSCHKDAIRTLISLMISVHILSFLAVSLCHAKVQKIHLTQLMYQSTNVIIAQVSKIKADPRKSSLQSSATLTVIQNIKGKIEGTIELKLGIDEGVCFKLERNKNYLFCMIRNKQGKFYDAYAGRGTMPLHKWHNDKVVDVWSDVLIDNDVKKTKSADCKSYINHFKFEPFLALLRRLSSLNKE